MAPGNDREAPPDRSDAAIVDQLLRKLRGGSRSTTKPVLRSVTRPAPTDPKAVTPVFRRRVHRTPAGIWGRVGLGVVLGSAVTQWPYQRACDWWLLLYLTVVTLTIVTGVWGAACAWKGHLALAHVVALATITWALALGAHEVLPRIGYAKHRAVWRCPPLATSAAPAPTAQR